MADPNQPAPDPQPQPTPPPVPQPKPGEQKPAEDKLTLTKDELQAQIQAALTADREKREKAEAKAREEAERKAAEEQGKFKELADKERAEKERLAAEVRTLRVAATLRDHLAEKHPEYVGTAKYILPLVPADADGDELAKAIESAAEQYVKDNPRQAKGGGAPAPLPRTPNRANGSGTHNQPRTPRQPSVASSRF